MMTPTIYRRAIRDDLCGASRAHAEAFNALNRQHGYVDQQYSASVLTPYLTFALDDPTTVCWIAETENTVSAIAIASVFDRTWFLSHLFVHPDFQRRGIGRSLLKRALDDESLDPSENRALITMAYNPASLGLYAEHGLLPRGLILRMETPKRGTAVESVKSDRDVRIVRDVDRALVDDLGAVDRETLGWCRDWHHRFFLSQEGSRCLTISQAGSLEAFAYVWSDGRIGPAAGRTSKALRAVFAAGLREVHQTRAKRIVTLVPANDLETFCLTMEAGMRVVLPFVFVSRKPILPVTNYLLHSPGLL